jgi:hypothetical protein
LFIIGGIVFCVSKRKDKRTKISHKTMELTGTSTSFKSNKNSDVARLSTYVEPVFSGKTIN